MAYGHRNSESLRLCPNSLFHFRKEIPPKEDQREEAAHQGVHRQAAAVGHLEDGERLLRVCSGAVPVRQGARRQGERRRTLPAGSELLLRKDLPQKLNGTFPEEQMDVNEQPGGRGRWTDETIVDQVSV